MAKKSVATRVTPNASGIAACRELFGDHPEDVISPIESAAETLVWLAEILSIISREAASIREPGALSIKKLADAARYIANDMGNYSDCRHEELLGHLRSAGAAPVEA